MKHDWRSLECLNLVENLKQAVQLGIELQGAAKAKPKGADASEWEEVAEEKLLVALGTIVRFCEGAKQ